jgi:hypothetical protein
VGDSARQEQIFLRQAQESAAYGSPLYAHLCRQLAREPLVAKLAPDLRWNLPLRLLAAVNEFVLAGVAPELARAYAGTGDAWPAFRRALVVERARILRFLREQPMQTNEVQRCYGLAPAFLLLARESGLPLDLVELGPSAGLNLLWDRYAYRYGGARWGPPDAPLELIGELRGELPEGLLLVKPRVGQRLGIELHPLDLEWPEQRRLLESFVWPDQSQRLERLRRGLEVLQARPPSILAGDYLELLGPLLAERSPRALTVVFQTASIFQLPREQRARLEDVLDRAGEDGRELAFLSAEQTEAREFCWQLELRRWPAGKRRLLAYMDFHGRWLEWL